MKILFVHQKLISFVEKDLEILQSAHQVRELHFKGMRDIPSLLRGTIWADITFSWFGKLHAFFAVLFSKILGKKAIVVAGGDDVACEPNIGYGMFAFWWKKWCPLFVFRYADLILPVSEFNKDETIKNAKADPEKTRMIYHGFPEIKFKRLENIEINNVERKAVAITVGGIDWERLERKGYERFVKSAAYLPEVQFVVIGQWFDDAIDYLRKIAADNVIFTGRVNDDVLMQWFSKAKIYVQISLHEGFGCSIAEAMLCDCIPVVSNRAAIPEVVGDSGFYVDELSPERIAKKIREALDAPDDLGQKARERIKTLFPIEKRKRELLNAIASVCNGSQKNC
ncbi:MAG: hypothetical protein HKUEN01_05490 [Candidatus Kuenenia stuttgartiensis]|nr:MAG: hypothetical protein HKUEN01_05490 [Candidatus Kuenenia stuttgartiensis]